MNDTYPFGSSSELVQCKASGSVARLALAALVAISLLLGTQRVLATPDCPGDQTYCIFNDCFCTLDEAEDFLRQRFPQNWCLEPSGESTGISPNHQELKYFCRDRPPAVFLGTRYYAESITGSGGICDGAVNGYGIVDHMCASEGPIVEAILERYEHHCQVDSSLIGTHIDPGAGVGSATGSHLPGRPVRWTHTNHTWGCGLPLRQLRVEYWPFQNGVCREHSSVVHWPIGRRKEYRCPLYYVPRSGALDIPLLRSLGCGGAFWTFEQSCTSSTTGTITVKTRQTCSDAKGNPCIPATGNKILAQSDWSAQGWSFTRHYSAVRDVPAQTGMGPHWTHNFGMRVSNPTASGNIPLYVVDEQNLVDRFNYVSTGLYRSVNKTGQAIYRDAGGFRLERPSGQVLQFDTAGRLVLLRHADSPDQDKTLEYEGGRLSAVVDTRGRRIEFEYAGDHLLSATFPDGTSALYSHTTEGHLATVAHYDIQMQAQGMRTYLYEPPAVPGYLTGILDENGDRHSTYAYDAYGRVISSERAGGAGSVAIEYPTTGNGLAEDQRRVTLNGTDERLYTYGTDWLRRMSTMVNDDGVVTNHYDSNQRLFRAIDARGIETRHLYEASGTLVRETERIDAFGTPEQRRRTQGWSSTINRMAEQSTLDAADTLQARWTRAFNARGELSAHCDHDPEVSGALAYTCGSQTHAPVGVRQTTYARCEQADVEAPDSTCPILGLLKSVDGPRTDVADVTTYAYYPADDAGCDGKGGPCDHRKGDLHTITNALGHVTEYLAYDGAGRALAVRDSNGVDTEFAYHARGWLLTRTVKGSGGAPDAVTTFAYDAAGNLTRITQPTGEFIDYEYDAAHRLEAIEDALGNRIEYELDAAGNRTREDTRDDQSTLKRTLSRVYNDLGRLIELKDAQNHTTVFDYDPNGNRTDETDPLLVETEHEYDPLNRLHRTLQDVGGIEADTGFEYDVLDRLVKVTDPKGLDTDYTYNALGDLLELDSPDTGVTTYTYDSAGNRLTQTDARGITATYAYDALNRLTAITYPDSQYDVAFHYDDKDNVNECTLNASAGRLARMVDVFGTTSYCYDGRGNLVEKRLDMHAALSKDPLVVAYEYDLADRHVAMVYPSGRRVEYGRDALGRISTVSMVEPGIRATQPIVQTVQYLPFGPPTAYQFANGQTLTKSYDQDYRIQGVASPALALAFELDAAGNIVHSGPTTGSWNETYGYDDLYRLTDVLDGTGAIQFDRFAYDATGNRVEREPQGGPMVPYAYPTDSHRLTSVDGATRTYDAMGNTLYSVDIGAQLSYGDHGRLVRRDPIQGDATVYSYNGRGERVIKATDLPICVGFVCPHTVFVYDEAGQLIGEYDLFGNVRKDHVWVDSTPVAMVDASNAVFYVHSDHLNTPRALTDSNGTLRWRWAFQGNAFGELAADSDPMSTGFPVEYNLRFPGQYFDAESGLHYNYFRDYEPGTGRYVESDPIGLGGGVSTYGYVLQNPMALLDAWGLTVYSCNRPMRNSGGIVPHRFICATSQDPTAPPICGGHAPPSTSGFLWSDGVDSDETFDWDQCNPTPPVPGRCEEDCVIWFIRQPRPTYSAVLPFLRNCFDWADDTIAFCKRQCAENPNFADELP